MLYLIIITAYLVFVALVALFFYRRKIRARWIAIIVIGLLAAPFWDIFLAKGIMLNFRLTHSPLQQINHKIEKPLSVLWLDEVWPGFDEYGRYWMVKNYLDGVNLHTLALNDGEGRIYLLQAGPEDYAESAKLKPEFERLKDRLNKLEKEAREGGSEEDLWKKYREEDVKLRQIRNAYEKQHDQDIVGIMARAQAYKFDGTSLPSALPFFNYTVRLHRLRLPDWQEKFVWSDGITIMDNPKNEEIAFSRRCLAYTPFTAMIMVGDSPFEGGEFIGDEKIYEFDDKLLFSYARVKSSEWIQNMLQRGAYRRAAFDWKNNQNKRIK